MLKLEDLEVNEPYFHKSSMRSRVFLAVSSGENTDDVPMAWVFCKGINEYLSLPLKSFLSDHWEPREEEEE